MTNFAKSFAAALLFAGMSQPACADDNTYLAAILGSKHFGNEYLNNLNPGVMIGIRRDLPHQGTEVFAEGGVFLNSYEEVSPMLLLGISTSVVETGPVEWRVGAAVGTAYYKELSASLEERYGIPNAGGFIPVVMASVAARYDRHELRFTAVPPDTDTDFILNLSYTIAF